ncbi:OmpH family outer membrane protein, partial [Candidatus Pelagibacter communis]|uniref:OmpH family outer membrane protein n=1 Tax=Pelagibacter ubique TaxID=198252 RepID=UPI000A57D985
MIKKVRVILSLFILLFSTQSIAEDKILFIDIEYVYINSVAGKKVSEFIVKERKKIDKDFSNYKKEIDEEKTKLMNQKNILSKEEFQKNTLSLQNK